MGTNISSPLEPNQVWAVLTAAGSGSRLGAAVPKALVRVGRQTLLEYALVRLLATENLVGVVITVPWDYLTEFAQVVDGLSGSSGRVRLVPGGASRQASVKAGLDALKNWNKEAGLVSGGSRCSVLVHDAARPLAPTDLMNRLAKTVEEGALAVIPGVPVSDTIKQVSVDEAGREFIVGTPERSTLRAAQTPQAFDWAILEQAHKHALARGQKESTAATDDAALVEEQGVPVQVIPGDDLAFKVTTAADLSRLSDNVTM